MSKLAQILYERRISQAKLARMASINQADLNAMMRGRRPAFPGWRLRIASVLEMSEDDVFPKDDRTEAEGKCVWIGPR